MYWNHRIVRTPNPGGEAFDEPYMYQIHEVHYNQEDKIIGWTEEQSPMITDASLDETSPTVNEAMKVHLERMIRASEKPILEVRDNKLVEID